METDERFYSVIALSSSGYMCICIVLPVTVHLVDCRHGEGFIVTFERTGRPLAYGTLGVQLDVMSKLPYMVWRFPNFASFLPYKEN